MLGPCELTAAQRALRDEYRALVAQHRAALEREAAQRNVTYAFMDTAQPPAEALARLLAARERLSRAR